MAEQILERYYKALQQKDYLAMQGLYHEEARFSDPVFTQLNSREVQAMWEMLLKRAKQFTLTYQILEQQENEGKGICAASYLFSKTGRQVQNNIQSDFTFKDGLIYRQADQFDLWRWSRQAFGLPGWLFGWTPAMQKKIRSQAMAQLHQFLQK